MSILVQILITIWERELCTFIKLQPRKRELNSEQSGERYAKLMENRELLLPDSSQIYQQEPWGPQ